MKLPNFTTEGIGRTKLTVTAVHVNGKIVFWLKNVIEMFY